VTCLINLEHVSRKFDDGRIVALRLKFSYGDVKSMRSNVCAAGLLLGSVAMQVIHLAEVPITLIK